ncbi:MAG: YggS family pyridoxal phosphate-dependent enzyme [Desulfomonile tiedjei]|uniref:Pyridoxal phosphate homeostasis protein n=1 Tax=Desulfomonile tiedjei TaxID=2358 RepID=A0A9D6UZS1_9BACT|nr:YggS family pyridoxal phosphate-dependent enzyme [Desulfomonile tiedjei]
MIAENLTQIKERIARAAERAQRNAEDVRIVAAAKGQGKLKIEEAIAAGISIIGHNYLQEAVQEVFSGNSADVEFHMIGHLQRNKAGKAAELFHVIQTVDDPRLAAALNSRCEACNRTTGVLIQVNLALEPQKSGIPEDEVQSLAEHIRGLPFLKLMGLMTMPPFFDDPKRARPYFARLRELREKLQSSGVMSSEMYELSMGMTGDFEAAVEEGATLVRIGSALFGPRS